MFFVRLLHKLSLEKSHTGGGRYIRKLLAYVRPQWHRMAAGVLLGMASAMFNAVMLIAFQLIFSLVLKGDAPMKGMVTRVPFVGPVDLSTFFSIKDDVEVGIGVVIAACAFIPLLIFARGFLSYLSSRIYTSAASHILYKIRNDLYQAILRQSLSFFNRSKGGHLIQVISQQANSLQSNALQLVQALTKHPMTIISILVVLFNMDWLFTLLSLFVFPLCIVPVRMMAKRTQKSGQLETKANADLLVCMHEAIGGIRVVKGNSREEYELQRFDKANATISIDALEFNKLSDLSGTFVETIASLGIAVGLVYWWNEGRTADQFFLLVLALTQMYPPIKELSRISMTMQKTIIATEAVFDLLEKAPEVADKPGAPTMSRSAGSLIFRGVTFAYPDISDPNGGKLLHKAVNAVNLRFEPGKFYALVGPSGSGKSTLFSLLLRFYDADSGAIEIDGNDIKSVTQTSLRENFGIVSQDVFLFHDTIRENIRYGRLDATDEEIMTAARKAHVDDFVQHIKGGYEAVVGDSGANLSGGQKQRISIARAILRGAPVLLLDEATSALDTEAERIIQEAVHELAEGRTVIAIAHRLSTVLAAHQIVVMKGGEVKAVGAHHELIKTCALYQRLYELQFDSQALLTRPKATKSEGLA
jgi:subfamily B ATP-binding cassette protein MsbA